MENNGITILGDDTEEKAVEVVKVETTDDLNKGQKPPIVLEDDLEKETEDVKKKPIIEKSPVELNKDDKEKIPAPKKEPEVETEGLKISFGNEKAKPKDAPTKQETVAPEITESAVLDFLKDKGISVNNFSELSKKEVLSDQVNEFKKFNAETNGTIADFYSIQKDWGKESDKVLLKAFYENSDPNLSEDVINSKIDYISVTEADEVELDDRELAKRKNDYAQEISKAKSFMGDFQKKYKVSLEKSQPIKPPTAEEIAKSHAPYWKSRDKALKGMADIKMSIEGLGDVVIPIDDDDRSNVSRNTHTLDAFIDRFKKEDGSMDAGLTVKSTLYSDPKFFQKAMQSVAEQVHALSLENFSKENRNVKLEKHKTARTETNEDGMVTIGKSNNESFAPRAVI